MPMLVATLSLAACGSTPAPAPTASATAHPFRSCPSAPSGMIDRVDFFAWHGASYLAVPDGVGRDLRESDLGAPFTTVRCTLVDHLYSPDFDQMQDGNAAFLGAGTVVYRVRGYAATFRLAAHNLGRIVLYEVDGNPAARTGADLLDVRGRVAAIVIESDDAGGVHPLATIADPARVDRLVDMLLASPVSQASTAGHDRPAWRLALQLRDGTVVDRAYSATAASSRAGSWPRASSATRSRPPWPQPSPRR